MTLPQIALGAFLALLATFLFSGKRRGFLLFTFSLLALFALQPALPIRYFDFWLPTLALGLVMGLWAGITPLETVLSKENLLSAAWAATLLLLLGLTRIIFPNPFLTASLAPRMQYIFLALVILALGIFLSSRVRAPRQMAQAGTLALVLLLIVLKSPQLSLWSAQLLRVLNGQSAETASSFDLRWLGFSYIAFRLIHTLQDHIKGRLPSVSLQEYITYLFFYPALSAGPIDRVERFVKDLRAPFHLAEIDWVFITRRMTLGLFKKFILADSLALIALSPANAAQVTRAPWAWILLYAYALQIYFDFSGYTDLALGVARLAGIQLPENFNQPYLKPNLTQFWNSWHMSLTQWLRAYAFNPLTRALRGTSLPVWSIILLTQLVSMTLIGLWHGVTLNFLIWGLWHGLGLFLHNRWQDAFRVRVTAWAGTPARQALLAVSGAVFTFQYVALGWIWFVLPTPQTALAFLFRLFGAA
jgi:D-alanyl-lipoteichoic acid acyltransferase DltB (MBOAT superfamily)